MSLVLSIVLKIVMLANTAVKVVRTMLSFLTLRQWLFLLLFLQFQAKQAAYNDEVWAWADAILVMRPQVRHYVPVR